MDNNPLSPDEESNIDHMTEGDGANMPPGADFDMAKAKRDFVGGGGKDGQRTEQEATSERTVLRDAGDVITLTARGLDRGSEGNGVIILILGSEDPTDNDNKRYILSYDDGPDYGDGFNETGGKSWVLTNPDYAFGGGGDSGAGRYLDDGLPFSLGRDSQSSPLPVDGSRKHVSSKHALLIATGDNLTIVHRSKNSTVVDTPKNAIISVDLKNQTGVTRGQGA